MATITARPSEGKRAACDRCRNQKLRCPREGPTGSADSTKCARCARAGADCNFSASLKAGKPAGANGNSSTKRKEGGRSSKNVIAWEAVAHEPEDHAFDDFFQADFLEQSLRDDAFGIGTSGSLAGTDTVDTQTIPSVDTTNMAKTLDPYSANELSMFSAAEQLDFPYNLETPNITASDTNKGGTLFDARYPVNFDPFIDAYNYSLQQNQRADLSDASWTSVCGAGHGPNVTSLDESENPPKTSREAKMSGALRSVPQSTLSNHRTKPSGTPRSIRPSSHTDSGDEMDCDPPNEDNPIIYQSKGCFQDEKLSHVATQDIRHRRMQELSQLGMTVYAELLETTAVPTDTKSHRSSSQSLNSLASKVLASSVNFLSLLTTLYPSSLSLTADSTMNPPSSARNPPCSSDEEDHPPSSPETSSSDLNISTSRSSAATPKSNGASCSSCHSDPERHHRRKRMRSSSSHPTRPYLAGGVEQSRKGAMKDEGSLPEGQHQPADMTEVFALLTCYIRLLHLHSLLYAKISDILTSPHPHGPSSLSASTSSPSLSPRCGCSKQNCPSAHDCSSTHNTSIPGPSSSRSASSSSSYLATLNRGNSNCSASSTPPTSRTPPLFPGLSLSGVSLDRFAKFQIKFLLQITTHTLGEIEDVLGLPDGYRISRRRADNSRAGGGILEGGCVSKGFVEMTMKERGLRTGSSSAAAGGRRSGKGGVGGAGSEGRGMLGKRLDAEMGTAGCDMVAFIRECLVGLRGLLKGKINP